MSMKGSNLKRWWTDDPNDPGRPRADNPHVVALAERIAPGSPVRDLGGHFSLNLHLIEPGLVLRVHDSTTTRPRLTDLQALRRHLTETGMKAGVTVPWLGKTVFRCGPRWAELERFTPHEVAAKTIANSEQLFHDLGNLHRYLATFRGPLTKPVIATWATPDTLRRWVGAARQTTRHDPEAARLADELEALLTLVRRQWVPLRELPHQFVHGDGKPNNLVRTATGEPVTLDLGFAAWRPRVHDLAYSLSWSIAAHGRSAVNHFPHWIDVFEKASGEPLIATEQAALPGLIGTLKLYRPAISGFHLDPVRDLLNQRKSIETARWWVESNPLHLI